MDRGPSIRRDFVSQKFGSAASFVELLVVAVILGFGVNLLASASVAKLDGLTVAGLGALVTLVACLYLVYIHFRDVHFKHSIGAAIFFDRDSKLPVEVPGYSFSFDTVRCAQAAFRENHALAKQWQGGPYAAATDPDSELAHALVKELVEYIILERLSAGLSDYFAARAVGPGASSPGEPHVYQRNDLPQILLANRFLELFSRDMKDRVGFENDEPTDGESDGPASEVVGLHYFHHFSLSLPKDCVVSRIDDGIEITSRTVALQISLNYAGRNADIPVDFEALYLGRSFDSVKSVVVSVDIEARVKRRPWHSARRSAQNLWAEQTVLSFIDYLDLAIFLDTIRWPLMSGLIRAVRPPAETPGHADPPM